MPLPDPPVMITFRDGEHSVPPHVASNIAISEIDTERYTYEEAVRLSDKALERKLLNDAVNSLIHRHFLVNR